MICQHNKSEVEKGGMDSGQFHQLPSLGVETSYGTCLNGYCPAWFWVAPWPNQDPDRCEMGRTFLFPDPQGLGETEPEVVMEIQPYVGGGAIKSIQLK